MKKIQNKLHKVRTYDVYKISISFFSYILDDGISSLAYFHKNVRSK